MLDMTSPRSGASQWNLLKVAHSVCDVFTRDNSPSLSLSCSLSLSRLHCSATQGAKMPNSLPRLVVVWPVDRPILLVENRSARIDSDAELEKSATCQKGRVVATRKYKLAFSFGVFKLLELYSRVVNKCLHLMINMERTRCDCRRIKSWLHVKHSWGIGD